MSENDPPNPEITKTDKTEKEETTPEVNYEDRVATGLTSPPASEDED